MGASASRIPRVDGVASDYVAALLGQETTHGLMALLDVSEQSDGLLDHIATWRLLSASISFSEDESHRLCATPVPIGNFELLIASMMQGQDILCGLRRLAAAAAVIRPDLAIRITTRRGDVRVGFSLPGTTSRKAAVYLEGFMLLVHCAIRWALGQPVEPRAVWGSNELAFVDRRTLLDVLGLPVQRHSGSISIVYHAADAARPFAMRDFDRWREALLVEYQRMVDVVSNAARHREAPGDRLAASVRSALISGARGQAAVARGLGVSVATLRRRLTEQQTSFRQILLELRRETAETLLLGDKSIDEIAAELGMSDARCLRRACQSWFGRSPSELRLDQIGRPKGLRPMTVEVRRQAAGVRRLARRPAPPDPCSPATLALR